MGLVSLLLCPGLKELDKDSTLNRVITLEIHCHGGGALREAPFHWTSLPSSPLCDVLAHVYPLDRLGVCGLPGGDWEAQGELWKEHGEARTAL